jgi:hypothetical protein
MSIAPKDDDVGYGRPPKRTRRKKGEGANRGLRYRKRLESGAEMLTRLLVKPVEITMGGETKKVPTLKAILLQLWMTEMSGDPRALNIRLKYQKFAQQHSIPRLEVDFLESDYTQSLAANLTEDGDDHE